LRVAVMPKSFLRATDDPFKYWDEDSIHEILWRQIANEYKQDIVTRDDDRILHPLSLKQGSALEVSKSTVYQDIVVNDEEFTFAKQIATHPIFGRRIVTLASLTGDGKQLKSFTEGTEFSYLTGIPLMM